MPNHLACVYVEIGAAPLILQTDELTGMNDRKKVLRHDRHAVSLLTDHLVITPEYRGNVLTGEVAFIAEAIIRGTCSEIDIAVNVDHVHILFQYPPKYLISYNAN